MKERPILFSAPMVRAILDGRKTQTRRIVQGVDPQDYQYCGTFYEKNGLPYITFVNESGYATLGKMEAKCAYGKPDDRLWVRETVAAGACAGSKPSEWSPSFWRREQGSPKNPNGLWYRADGLEPDTQISSCGKWKPSIFMPRWASRITLEITDIRVERLQEISDTDAWAEGCSGKGCSRYEGEGKDLYQDVWITINGPKSWEQNPWVWVIEFKRVGHDAI